MRLIDADILLKQMKHRKEYIGRPSDPVCLVEDASTVDAVPVKHGRWKYVGALYNGNHHECAQYNCSECGLSQTFIDVPAYYSFCPICGAKMDDGEDS